MADRADAAIARTLEHEGGFVDHPADRGGPTNLGITLATLAAWRQGRGDPAPSVDDLRALTRAEAVEIYRDRYWRAAGCEALPPPVDAVLFDMAVNHGPRAAVVLLQEALAALGLAPGAPDGIPGPRTRAAAARAASRALALELLAQRGAFYMRVCAGRPSQQAFALGWARRLVAEAAHAGQGA